MAAPRIAPEDVSAEGALKILAFLNAAQSAQEIADGIELADEPDVGRRLAEHLLEARGRLGSFASLAQVAAVPKIGAVRFTRIVRALVPPPQPATDSPTVQALVEEVRQLRAELDALRSAARPPRVTLRVVEPARYLGQPATVLATVRDADGRPRGDASVALSTSWGRFHAADGFTTQEGTGVVVRTAADGSVAVTLLPPTSEDVEPVQQEALEATLNELDAAADTPQAILEELRDFARQYRWEVNDELRAAVDIYFRDFHQHLVERVNFRDELLEWRMIDAVVLAHVQDRDADGAVDSAVQASAALDVNYRDWLGPWLQVYLDLAASESTLADELGLATNSDGVDDLVGRVHNRVGTYVTLHPGVVGQLVGQRVAGDALDTFLTKHVEKLPIETQLRVFPAARAANATLVGRGAAGFEAFASARADVTATVADGVASSPAVATLHTALSAVQAALALTVDVNTFNAAIASKVDETALGAALANKVDTTTFDATMASKVDRTTFDNAIRTKVDTTTFTSALAVKVDQTAFTTAIASKVDQSVFTAGLAAKVDAQTLNTTLAAARSLTDLQRGVPIVRRIIP
jgi:hypothetical protein